MSRSPKKKKGNTAFESKLNFYKRRLQCLEEEHKMKVECFKAEHEIKMYNLKLGKEMKELELLEKKRKLGIHNKEN